jgi:hypothetical protein
MLNYSDLAESPKRSLSGFTEWSAPVGSLISQ